MHCQPPSMLRNADLSVQACKLDARLTCTRQARRQSINQFCYNEAREGPSPPNVNSGTTTIVPPLYATQLLQSGTCRHTRLSKSRTCTRRKATVRGLINAHGQPKQASTSSTCCCGTTQAGMHTFQNTRQLLHVSTAAQKLATAPLLMLQGHGHCSYHSTRFTAVLPPTPWTHHAMPAAPARSVSDSTV